MPNHYGTENYEGLDVLLSKNANAARYFQSLPGYIQSQIRQRAGNVCSESDLHDYADKLLENI